LLSEESFNPFTSFPTTQSTQKWDSIRTNRGAQLIRGQALDTRGLQQVTNIY